MAVRMRGEVCIGSATFLAFVALILLIFTHLGQVNLSTVPRGIYLMSLNASNYGTTLEAITGDPTPGLYNTTDADAPLDAGLGLRQIYKWGFYGHCAFISDPASHSVNSTALAGTCSNTSFPSPFSPLSTILADVPPRYFFETSTITTVGSTNIHDLIKAGFWLVFLGTIAAGIAMFTGFFKHWITFTLAAAFSIFGSICLFLGAIILTVAVSKSRAINNYQGRPGVPLGFNISFGPALWFIWGAFAALFLSVTPYIMSCCTFPRRK